MIPNVGERVTIDDRIDVVDKIFRLEAQITIIRRIADDTLSDIRCNKSQPDELDLLEELELLEDAVDKIRYWTEDLP